MTAALRVERGTPTDDELAAVMVALLVSLAPVAPAAARPLRRVGWGSARGYRAPGSWTSR